MHDCSINIYVDNYVVHAVSNDPENRHKLQLGLWCAVTLFYNKLMLNAD